MDENRKGFYQNKLNLEGKMMCVNCGEIIPNGSVYCSICGKKAREKQDDTQNSMTPIAEDTMVKCQNCGQAVEKDSIFCKECGHKLE